MIDIETVTMTDYRPFRAHHYNPSKINLSQVIAPPYDVISVQEQEDLYEQSPYNVVRLILNKEKPDDSDQDNRYTRARNFFSDWCHEQILLREEKPCFFLYRQIFRRPETGEKLSRFSLLGILKLEPFEKGIVVAHEQTLARPKADRRRLLETTQTNFSPVFGLYEDESEKLPPLFSEILKAKPNFYAVEGDTVHEVWKISEDSSLHEIQEFISGKNIYIADGHHRYQTALDYAREMHRKEGVPEARLQPYDFVLMALVRFEDEGLVLLPTHRAVKPFSGFDPKKLLESLKPFFKVEAVPGSFLQKGTRYLQGLTSFDLVLKDDGYHLTLEHPEKVKALMPPGKPEIWYSLDVNLLAYLIFHKLMDLAPEAWETQLRFTHSEQEVLEWVKRGEVAAAFLLRAPQVKILKQMGEVKELMPQKSTYFYPKLASGLVFYHHQE
ncbi:MAG: DUF1015 domain-containing protein [Candidatus Omnitrophica bacterium]|nr:DUF1015 domain-containing protein [Candidatus Omnitrophota bacterium]